MVHSNNKIGDGPDLWVLMADGLPGVEVASNLMKSAARYGGFRRQEACAPAPTAYHTAMYYHDLIAGVSVITLNVVAEATGINRMTLSKIANHPGSTTVSDHLDKLCRYFNCQVGDLAVYVPDEKPTKN